jgi:uncharacterized protein (TIGR02266 family)
MTDDQRGLGGQSSGGDDLVEIDLNFESMRRFQAEFSPNLSKGGLFIDTGEPLDPGSVVRFRVILPEEFVFLEGTAVVEWKRSAEAVCDGAPGMALRFVTLSPQNQELVEQLVQDHIDTGGSPFDLDVQPVPADFPTDSLEGAPAPSTDSLDEGYRLTVRHTGPGIQAEALQANAEVIPSDEGAQGATEPVDEIAKFMLEAEDATPPETEAVAPVKIDASVPAVEEVHGFEIVSKAAIEPDPDPVPSAEEIVATPEPEVVPSNAIEPDPDPVPPAEEIATTLEPEIEVESSAANETALDPVSSVDDIAAAAQVETSVVGDPPEFDWSAELDIPVEPVESSGLEAAQAAEPDAEEEEGPEEVPVAEPDAVPAILEVEDDITDTKADFNLEETVAIPDVLPTPSAFDEGPEVMDNVHESGLGGPAFDVSLPDHDDEPDTTPVLPDEGRDDVTVTPEDDFEEPPRRRRRWPLALVAVFVLAVSGGFLWPHARDWLASRGETPVEKSAAVESPQGVEEVPLDVSEQPPVESEESPQSAVDPEEASAEVESSEAVVVEDGVSDDVIAEIVVEEPAPEPTPAMVRLGAVDAVTAIDVEPGQAGTVMRIRANGSLEDGVLSMETLSSPPRVLIRVRGITSTYRPYTIESMTPEVTRVRIGLHEDRRPSELWIVVDLTEPEVVVGGVSIRRDLAELVLARP